MDHASSKGTGTLSTRRRKPLARGGVALVVIGLLSAGLALAVRQNHLRHQRQVDPEVATVWLMAVTHGPNHVVTRGSVVQRWANTHNIHALGDYQRLTGSFNGYPDGLEFWFDYDSHISAKELECHRVGATAFVDDLGQTYHGFLDLQGKTIGVYLPGYDHAAHRITCTVHWMPRRPAAPFPVSRPMIFTTALPASRRLLPPASTLPADPITVAKNGVTVTISDLHLGAPTMRTYSEGQRDLMFQLHVQGGEIADENVAMDLTDSQGLSTHLANNVVVVGGQVRTLRGRILSTRIGSGRAILMSGSDISTADSFKITDPYGISLVPETASVMQPTLNPRKGRKISPYWIAPVTGTGRGTDCVQLHFHVQPPARSPQAMPPEPVTFDIPVRVSPNPASEPLSEK